MNVIIYPRPNLDVSLDNFCSYKETLVGEGICGLWDDTVCRQCTGPIVIDSNL